MSEPAITFRPFRRAELRLSLASGPGDGPRAMFQHGLCGDAAQTMEVMPHGLVAARTLECRGHGGSDAGRPDSYDIATFADDVAAAIEAEAPVAWVGGISMGAAIALRLAVTRPALVRGLVLVRPAWMTGAAPENLTPNVEVGQRLSQTETEGEISAFHASPTGQCLADKAPDNLASLTRFFTREPRDVTAALLTRISASGPGVDEDDLRRLDIRVLVIGTDDDLIHPMDHARALADLIPGAKLVKITSKVRDAGAYRSEFRAALCEYTKDLTDA